MTHEALSLPSAAMMRVVAALVLCAACAAPRTEYADDSGGAAGGEAEAEAEATSPEPMMEPQQGMAPSGMDVTHTGGLQEYESMIELDSELESQFQASAVDCSSARDLAGSICELAGRICEIAEQTGDPSSSQRCDDGQARCERAQDRTSNVCP